MQWMNWKIEDYQYIADRRIIKRNGREGVSSNGDRIIVPLIYDNIIAIGINGRSQAFHQQFFKVRRFGKWGVISKDGKEILPCEYDLVDDFKGDVDLIMVGKNDLCGLLDLSFRWVIPCKYEQLNPFSYQGKICFAKNKLWGWMNMDERIIVPPKYDEINWMYDGRMQVVRDKRYGVVDSTGKEIIPLQYQYVHTRFYNGLIMASLNNKWGFIDSVNHIVIPFEYDAARNFEKSITAVVRGKKYGFINRQNVAVTGFKYDFAGHEWSYDNKLLVRKNNLTGYVDETGQEVIPCVYEEEDGFSPALGHHMRKGTTWSYVK
jgi:hypothetical protein